jgi:hypothetical protein
LAANGKPTTVAEAAIAADFHEALDVEVYLAAQVTLDGILAVDELPESAHLLFRELSDASSRIDVSAADDLLTPRVTDAVDVGQGDHDRLVSRYVDARDSSHPIPFRENARPPPIGDRA